MILHMRVLQRVCEAHPMHLTTDDHVRFTTTYPALFKSAGMILEGKLVHSAEVPPVYLKLGRICAEFVVGAFCTFDLALRADQDQTAIETLEIGDVYHLVQGSDLYCPR
jgi:hypothetical protein